MRFGLKSYKINMGVLVGFLDGVQYISGVQNIIYA